MLTIRLTRKGKKNQPFFRVVVIDKRRSSKGGRAVEDLGYKNPLTKKVSLNKERILYWLSKGAKPSATIHNLLVAEKVIEGKKINVTKKSKKPPVTPAAPVPTPAIEPSALIVEPTPAEEPTESAPVIESAPAPVPEKPAETPKPEEPKPAENPPAVEAPTEQPPAA